MKKQVYKLGLVAFLGFSAMTFAQVGINEETPKATLDVKAKTTDATAEGILIPRVSEAKAEAMGGNVEESTLIYIDEATDASTQTYTAEVDTKGFYFFTEDNKWKKVGGGSASSSVETYASIKTGGENSIRTLQHISINDWTEGTFCLIQTGNVAIQLPDPAGYKNRTIAVNNQYTNSVNYDATNQPKNIGKVSSGKGHLLISDGTYWYALSY